MSTNSQVRYELSRTSTASVATRNRYDNPDALCLWTPNINYCFDHFTDYTASGAFERPLIKRNLFVESTMNSGMHMTDYQHW